jgi:hypothetical protein
VAAELRDRRAALSTAKRKPWRRVTRASLPQSVVRRSRLSRSSSRRMQPPVGAEPTGRAAAGGSAVPRGMLRSVQMPQRGRGSGRLEARV